MWVILVALLITGCRCASDVAVPAFFGLNDPNKPPVVPPVPPVKTYFARIQDAGKAVRIVVPDASFEQASGTALIAARVQFAGLRASGQLVLGYVSTQNGTRPLEEVTGDVDVWYAQYPTTIDGIFFDEGPDLRAGTDKALLTYYAFLGKYVRTNPKHFGRDKVLLNAAQFPYDWVLTVADYVITWENCMEVYVDPNLYNAQDASGTEKPPAWWTSKEYRPRRVHVIWNVPESAMSRIIDLAKDRGAGLVYVFDGTSAAYSKVPPYFEQEYNYASQASWWYSIPDGPTGGQCPPRVDPLALAFTSASAPQTVTITNNSISPILLGRQSINGPGFTITKNGCGGSLSPRASCQIDVAFPAGVPGQFAAELDIPYSTGSMKAVRLTGTQ